MATPYVSSRTGTAQWLMQRISAFLLLFLAFLHFGMQHFTSDAVTTGLTVSARANNPWWQAYYVAFVVLALYHGVNGVVGIVRDYRPQPLARGLIELTLWTLAAYFGVIGVKNFIHPLPLGGVKEFYARNGLPVGESAGHPPIPGGAMHYDFRDELRELHLLAFYLDKHTHRTDGDSLATVFGHAGRPDAASASLANVTAAGAAFDEWLLAQVLLPALPPERRDRGEIFSTTHEFAIWAAAVRIADAENRRRTADELRDPQRDADDAAIIARLGQVPLYSATALH
jgi:succinate dehydrogenase hydrophobic anchor subunit